MRKLIPRPVHAVLDYMYGLKAIAAPHIMGFADEEAATNICHAIGVSTITSAALTKHEGGVVKAVPFNTHLKMDLASGLFLAAAPWLFGFSDNARARNTFLGLAALDLAVVALSKPDTDYSGH